MSLTPELSYDEFVDKQDFPTAFWMNQNAKKGMEVELVDAYRYMAWTMTVGLNRVMYACDDKTAGVISKILEATAQDCQDRWDARITGKFPPPDGKGFPTMEDYTEWQAAQRGATQNVSKETTTYQQGHGTYL